jgi:hypothetical protein
MAINSPGDLHLGSSIMVCVCQLMADMSPIADFAFAAAFLVRIIVGEGELASFFSLTSSLIGCAGTVGPAPDRSMTGSFRRP